MDKIPFTVDFTGYLLSGWFKAQDNGMPPRVFHVAIDNVFAGTLRHEGDWQMDGILGPELAPVIGEYIQAWWQ